MRSRTALIGLLVLALGSSALLARANVSSRSPTAIFVAAKVDVSHLNPISVSFDSLENGWVLATTSCAKRHACLSLLETNDGARSWSSVSLPSSFVADADRNPGSTSAATYGAASVNVRFANNYDGWVYGTLPGTVSSDGLAVIGYRPVLWSTHDGGRTWRRVSLPWESHEPSIYDVEADNGTVYAETLNRAYHVTLSSSPVGVDAWRTVPTGTLYLPAGGAQPTGAIALSGSSGWMVAGNDRGVSASLRVTGNGRWSTWTPPCESVGNSYAVPAASSPRDLVVVCQMGGFASPLSPTAPAGATLGSNWLYFSSNGGRSFTSGPELKPRNFYFSGVLASPRASVVVLSRGLGGSDDLMASFDRGRTWRVVYRGEPTYLSFTNSQQGVALIQRHFGDDSMIMTFNGGRDWRVIRL